jgi:hypothetical protein
MRHGKTMRETLWFEVPNLRNLRIKNALSRNWEDMADGNILTK